MRKQNDGSSNSKLNWNCWCLLWNRRNNIFPVIKSQQILARCSYRTLQRPRGSLEVKWSKLTFSIK